LVNEGGFMMKQMTERKLMNAWRIYTL